MLKVLNGAIYLLRCFEALTCNLILRDALEWGKRRKLTTNFLEQTVIPCEFSMDITLRCNVGIGVLRGHRFLQKGSLRTYPCEHWLRGFLV